MRYPPAPVAANIHHDTYSSPLIQFQQHEDLRYVHYVDPQSPVSMPRVGTLSLTGVWRCGVRRRWDSGERSPCLDGVDRQTEFHDTGTSASQKVKLSVFCILRWESVGGSWAFFDPSVSRNSPLFRSGSTWDQDPHLSLLSRLSWQSYWPISRILWCKAPPSVSPHTGDKLPFLLSHPGQCPFANETMLPPPVCSSILKAGAFESSHDAGGLIFYFPRLISSFTPRRAVTCT
jgi:hypothetical protein